MLKSSPMIDTETHLFTEVDLLIFTTTIFFTKSLTDGLLLATLQSRPAY